MTPELICVSKTTATFRLNGEVQQAEVKKDPEGDRYFQYSIVKGKNVNYWLPAEFQPRKKR